jgi:hypothetical protein
MVLKFPYDEAHPSLRRTATYVTRIITMEPQNTIEVSNRDVALKSLIPSGLDWYYTEAE